MYCFRELCEYNTVLLQSGLSRVFQSNHSKDDLVTELQSERPYEV